MERNIILLSGPVASGKSKLADQLAGQFDLIRVETGRLLKARLGDSQSGRVNLQQDALCCVALLLRRAQATG